MQRTRDELWSPDMKRSINSEKTLSHLPRKPPITSAPIANAEERNNLQVPGFPTLSHTVCRVLKNLNGKKAATEDEYLSSHLRTPNPKSVFSDKIKGRTRVVSSDARPQFLEATRWSKASRCFVTGRRGDPTDSSLEKMVIPLYLSVTTFGSGWLVW